MRHVDLDPVGAVIQLLASRFACLDRAVDELGALGHVKLRRIVLERVASSGGNGTSCDEQPWPGNVATFDGLLDADVAVARAFSLYITQSGESLLQRAPRGNRRPGRAKRQRIFQNVDVVSALCRSFTL